MADPIFIPELPGGYCASPDRLVLLAELLNLNFDIFATAWETAFSETISLPGVPPMTLTMPGVNIPGLPGFSRTFSSAPPPNEYAWVGNRFPFQSGGEIVKGRYEFPGFPETIVDPRSVVIPGKDPMAITMDWVRMNFDIIVQKFDERGITPPELGFDMLAIITCQTDETLRFLNSALTNINDAVPGTPPDGAPIGDSEVPDFGPGSGGVGSCWVITNDGEVIDIGGGLFGVHWEDPDGTDPTSNLGGTITLTCAACSFVAPSDGVVRVAASWTGNTGGSQGNTGIIVEVLTGPDCANLSVADDATDTASGGACDNPVGGCAETGDVNVTEGQTVSMRVTGLLTGGPPFQCGTQSVTVSGPQLVFSATSIGTLC